MRRTLPAIYLVALWALVILVGCSRDEPQTNAPLLASRWLLVSFRDGGRDYPVPTDFVPFMDIDAGSVLFSSSCNITSTTAHFEDGKVEVELTVLRGVGCGEAISQAGIDLEDAVPMSMGRWATYTLQGDELIIPFEGGQAHFTRAFPPNAAGLRAFPVRRGGDVEPTYDDSEGLLRGPILLEDGCLRIGNTDNFYSSYLIIWPSGFAAAFDEQTAWASGRGWQNVRVGDEVVLSGGRLLEIEPLLDAEVLRLDTVPDFCPGPYWVVEDVLPLE